jgi:UDPglucose--hexose-1-phosphate uridylyltransferase
VRDVGSREAGTAPPVGASTPGPGSAPSPAPGGMALPREPLPRTTFLRPDGRRIHVYGEVRGAPLPGAPRAEPTALHLRRDELSGSWVAVSPARNVRPHSSAPSHRGTVPGSPAAHFGCPLCPGGPELAFGYEAAVFDNRFPSFTLDPPAVPDPTDPRFAPSLGACEVVMFTERHEGNVATLTPAETARVVAVWRDRTAELWSNPRIAFVMPFENRGEAIGATLSHPHGQIYAFGHVPPWIERRVAALAEGRARTGGCVSCAVVADELASERIVRTDPHWAISVPFAPRWPFEVHIRATRHGVRRLADLADDEARALAGALHDVVERYNGLFGFELPYMLVVLEAPRDANDWHLAVELYPPHRSERLMKVRASVETATLLFINDTLPEENAALLRAVPVVARDEHPGFVVVPSGEIPA